ncbi:replication initiator protein [Microviridae sp.]|nr:replication initiator protein [Microviridae sp.]
MCLRPLKMIIDQNEITAPCRKCSQCMRDRKIAWIGRMLAAEQTAIETWFCTFTYGGGYENEDAYWLDYRDLQRTFKKMRRAGHKFQYVSVGEYGSENARAHFHAVIFWQSTPPDRVLGLKYNMPNASDDERCSFWEHGIVRYEEPKSQQAAAAYMMDYLDKENMQKNALKFSKNPALGQPYLLEYARERAVAGLALFPDGPSFTIPGNTNKNNKPFWYRLDTNSAIYERMLQTFIEEWVEKRPNQRIALSECVIEYLTEMVQDTSKQSLAVRRYLSNQYGYEPVDTPTETFTAYAINDACVIDDRYNMATIYNEEGIKIWQKPVLDAGAIRNPVDQAEANRLMLCVLAHAPPRIHHHLRQRFPPSSELGRLLLEQPPQPLEKPPKRFKGQQPKQRGCSPPL